MRAFHGIPDEGTIQGEYAPKSAGSMLSFVSVVVGSSALLSIPYIWMRTGSPPSMWFVTIFTVGFFLFMGALTIALHVARRGITIELNFDAHHMRIVKRGYAGVKKERVIRFEDILHVTFLNDRSDGGQGLTVHLRDGEVTLHDSLSNFDVIRATLEEIASQTDALPLRRMPWFQVAVVAAVGIGTILGTSAVLIALGWL